MSTAAAPPSLRWWEEIRPHMVVIAYFCVLLLALSLQNRGGDPDFWWHLRTGQWIVEQGSIPQQDDYSYTAQGQPWIAHSWLSDVAMYLLYRYVGPFSLPLLRSLLHTACFALLLKLVWERWPRLGGSLSLILLAFFASAKFWLVRPNSLSLALVILLLYLWHRYKYQGRDTLWAIPPLMLLWANLHSGWIYGLLLLGALWFGEAIALFVPHIWPDLRPLEKSRWRRLGLFSLLSVPTLLLNPYGLHLLIYPFRYWLGNITLHTHYVGEWLSPDFHQPSNLLLALLLLLLIGGLAWRRSGLGPAETMALLLFTGLSLRSVRAAGSAIPLLAWSIAGLLGQGLAPSRSNPSRRGAWPRPKQQRTWLWYGGSLFFLLLLLLPIGLEYAHWGQQDGFLGENPDLQQAASVILHLPQEARLFNSYNMGGYLIWRLYPQQRVFIDGRADLYGDDIFAQYMRVWRTDSSWAQVLESYDVQITICERDTALATLLLESPSWDPLYLNATAAVFQKAP
ncbi:MAG: hypothetical protein JXA37_04745 [Chloroflexia bacterium]|nr:hypothetical protein [Chloroflexia bacterium]